MTVVPVPGVLLTAFQYGATPAFQANAFQIGSGTAQAFQPGSKGVKRRKELWEREKWFEDPDDNDLEILILLS